MFKWIILFIIFTIYSIVMFMFGRGFGIQVSCSEVKALKWKVMLLENKLCLLSTKENEDEC